MGCAPAWRAKGSAVKEADRGDPTAEQNLHGSAQAPVPLLTLAAVSMVVHRQITDIEEQELQNEIDSVNLQMNLR